jgi:hypothetical protein
MTRVQIVRRLSFVAVVSAAACSEPRRDAAPSAVQCGENARRVVRAFGERMRLVSRLSPATVQREAAANAYDLIVTPELLERWQSGAEPAPGREVSNPFPARIDIRVVQAEANECSISGDVVYVTSADTLTPVERRPITLRVREAEGWRVRDVELENAEVVESRRAGGSEAAAVVQRYYDAIDRGDYPAAYRLWAEGGAASRQTEAEFVAGFADTEDVRVTVSDSISMEGAAGSHYATVPITIEATLRDGSRQRFVGSYTLRRSVVDGATPAQRSWRIHSAKIRDSATN